MVTLQQQLDLSLFFWQVGLYVDDDTLRIPEQPGIWHFSLDGW